MEKKDILLGKFPERTTEKDDDLLEFLMAGIEMEKYEDPLWILPSLSAHFRSLSHCSKEESDKICKNFLQRKFTK